MLIRYGNILRVTGLSMCVALTPFSLPGFLYGTSVAQTPMVNQECDMTQLYQPGYGWIPGSEEYSCTTSITYLNDGSEYLNDLNSSCGGGPCPTAPGDSGDTGNIDPSSCEFEQGMENERDRLASEIADEIRLSMHWVRIEFSAVIYFNGSTYRRDSLDTGTENNVGITFEERPGEVVAAIVHSHPFQSYSSPTPADWSKLSERSTASGGGAHYILNYNDNTLYEYDASDKPRLEGAVDGTEANASDAQGTCDD